jgi:phage tail sheath protein FI
VWGARTLDGNSQDWRYINVRRTLIFIEQSLKLAANAYVFEPNTANTWSLVTSMMNNFLNNIWAQGALVGATPDEAFSVSVGLGLTMTSEDILEGRMIISVKVAVSRPAEFIIINIQQQMQTS